MSNLPDYSEVERLRLQLHHAELQRDAFKAMAEARLDVLIREALAKQKPRIHGMDIPDPDTFRHGVPADPAKVAAYAQPNKGTETWLKKQAEAEAHPIYGWLNMSNDKLLKRIEYVEDSVRSAHQRIDTLHQDHNSMDGIIDRVSQRVDGLSLEVKGIEDAGQKLVYRVETLEHDRNLGHSIGLIIERMEARLKQLESKRHG